MKHNELDQLKNVWRSNNMHVDFTAQIVKERRRTALEIGAAVVLTISLVAVVAFNTLTKALGQIDSFTIIALVFSLVCFVFMMTSQVSLYRANLAVDVSLPPSQLMETKIKSIKKSISVGDKGMEWAIPLTAAGLILSSLVIWQKPELRETFMHMPLASRTLLGLIPTGSVISTAYTKYVLWPKKRQKLSEDLCRFQAAKQQLRDIA